MLNVIKKTILISSTLLLVGCAKGKDFYEKAVDDLKTRLVNPDSMKVIASDGYELDYVYYIRINIEAVNTDNQAKRGTYYYHSEGQQVIFDGENDRLYFVASLSSESHHYTYK